MSLSREECVALAKMSEQLERFEDMMENMKKVVMFGQELSVEERNLLSVAYKNSVGSRRSSWRMASSLEEKKSDNNHIELVKSQKKQIEKELNTLCQDILSLLDNHLLVKASTCEARVFYLKMKGDYLRYIAEFASGQEHKTCAEGALKSYKEACEASDKELSKTHPIRLGLALNFSVFYYEVMRDPEFACNLAKQAFDDAIAEIEQIEESQYKDATTIMQLIRDNLTLWSTDLDPNDDPKEPLQTENN